MSMYPIAKAVGTGSSGTISFTSIPQTFTHLQLRCFTRATSGSATGIISLRLSFNGISGTSYSWHRLYGTGVAATFDAGSNTSTTIGGVSLGTNSRANCFAATIYDILDYTNTNKNKTVRCLTGADINGSGETRLTSGLFLSTNAITSISLVTEDVNFNSNSVVQLYGISTSSATGA